MFTCTQAFVVIWDEMYLYILNTFDSVCVMIYRGKLGK